MSKPVFRHDLHVKLWDIIANNPGISKSHAFHMLCEETGEDIARPSFYCFACEAHRTKIQQTGRCTSSDCPLCWEIDGHVSYKHSGCIYDSKGEKTGLFALWSDAVLDKDDDACAVLAARIRDLPLSPTAHDTYSVVTES